MRASTTRPRLRSKPGRGAAEAPAQDQDRGLHAPRPSGPRPRLLGNEVRAPRRLLGIKKPKAAASSAQTRKSPRTETRTGGAAPSFHRQCPIGTSLVGEVSPGLGTRVSGPLCPANFQSPPSSLRGRGSPAAPWARNSEESRGKVEVGSASGVPSHPPLLERSLCFP